MKPTPLIPSLLAALVLLAATPQLRAEPAIALQCLVNAVDNDLGGLICEMQRWIQSTPDKSVPVPSSQDYFLVIGHPIQSQMVDGQAFRAALSFAGVKQGTTWGSIRVYKYLAPYRR